MGMLQSSCEAARGLATVGRDCIERVKKSLRRASARASCARHLAAKRGGGSVAGQPMSLRTSRAAEDRAQVERRAARQAPGAWAGSKRELGKLAIDQK
eukprot:3200087-Pyramimonas_sp.AAC.1